MSAAFAGTASPVPAENLLLSALPEACYRRLRPHLELVPLPSGRVLSEPGGPVPHVFFPTSGIVCLRTPLVNGTAIGTALIGKESLIGKSVILQGLGARGPLYRTVVQSPGYAYRMRSDCLLQEFERGGELQRLLLRAIQAQIAQIAQNVVCCRRHLLSQRLCAWLLSALDRLPDHAINITQCALAELLGVRREGVTEAAGHLQDAGCIEYRRGHIHVSDRPALESAACECYAVVSREYARLTPAPARPGAKRVPRYNGAGDFREDDRRLHV